jgi:CspA family cold shock protein
MATGTVKWFNSKKGFGFIKNEEDGIDAFVHFKSIIGDGYRTLNEGSRVEFDLRKGPKGAQAENVRVIVTDREDEESRAE